MAAAPVTGTAVSAVARAVATTSYVPDHPLDVRRTLASLGRGRGDPTTAVDARGLWRTAATPEGPGTLHLAWRGGVVEARGWGEGGRWLVAGVPELLGSRDEPEAFAPDHPLLADAHRRLRGLRTPRCRLVFEMTAAAVLEQKVTGREARRSWRHLVRLHGTAAPGPAPLGLMVAPPAAGWRRIPSWDWHRAGVDGKRSRTVLAAAEHARHLERSLTVDDPAAILRQVPGIGVWTAAEVLARAHGDADAVSYGDFHIPSTVGWALAGRPFDDVQLERFLAPWAGHRGRVVRLVECSGFRPPRFGPRFSPADHRAI